MGSSPSRLSPLQSDLLQGFFEREQRFVLTGGGALAGFHLGHRESKDLDFFARPPVELELAERAIEDAARACGATCRSQVRYPEFRRFLVQRGADTTLVDLVIDRAPEVDPVKPKFGIVRVDSLREIAANKICTILSRCEIRDLVDLRAILSTGIDLGQALHDAERKDAGVNPATLAWLLGELHIASDAPLPGGADAELLRRFQADLIRRLRAMAFPDPGPDRG
jgi:nucleotidyltransferase AbiEii toxin of type IV toxin-antitoxin system